MIREPDLVASARAGPGARPGSRERPGRASDPRRPRGGSPASGRGSAAICSFGPARDDRERADDRVGGRIAASPPTARRARAAGRRRGAIANGWRRAALALPLVEAVDGDEAALPPERVAEGRVAVSVSARALNIREPTFARVGPVGDQAPAVRGDRPAVLALDDDERPRRSGATLKRGPGSSASGSAAKISASSDAGRCWLNRPHMAGKSSGRSCIVGRDGPATRSDARPSIATSPGPLEPRGGRPAARPGRRAPREPATTREALATYQRVVGFDDPEVTAAALLGHGPGALPDGRRGRRGPDLGGDPRAARDDLDLSRLAERRRGARPRRRPERGDRGLSRGRSAGARRPTSPRSRTGSAGWPRRPATSGRRGATSPAAAAAVLPYRDVRDHRDHGRGVARGDALDATAPRSIDTLAARQAGGRRRRDLAAVDGDARSTIRSNPAPPRSSTCTRCISPGPIVERLYGSIAMLRRSTSSARSAGRSASFAFGGAAARGRGVGRDLRAVRDPLRRDADALPVLDRRGRTSSARSAS